MCWRDLISRRSHHAHAHVECGRCIRRHQLLCPVHLCAQRQPRPLRYAPLCSSIQRLLWAPPPSLRRSASIDGVFLTPLGENIYVSSGSSATGQPTSAVDNWDSEKQYYTLSTNSCSGTCGHYTQNVWAATTSLGCSVRPPLILLLFSYPQRPDHLLKSTSIPYAYTC